MAVFLRCSALSVGLSAPLILTLMRLDKSAIIDGFSNDVTRQSIGRKDFVAGDKRTLEKVSEESRIGPELIKPCGLV